MPVLKIEASMLSYKYLMPCHHSAGSCIFNIVGNWLTQVHLFIKC